MSTTVVTGNDKWAGVGTACFHVALVAMLFLVKCPTTGGGGGNDGLGESGFMSMDVAGIGNSVDGWGPTEETPTPVQQNDVVKDESSAVTDETPTNEAPVVNSNKPSKTQTTTKPVVTPTPKPIEKPQDKPTQAANVIKGSGSSSGNTNQGAEDGKIDGKGVVGGGGGSAGAGGGQGGGTGIGTGTGTGPGSGPGSGGLSANFDLQGRTMNRKPSITETAPDEGKVVVDIWVDKNGNVTKAVANAAKSNTTNSKLYALAEKAAKTAKFNANPNGNNEQKGTITINFKLN